jgi:thiamine biosynthesis lipoprotein
VRRALRVSELTRGAFDITFASAGSSGTSTFSSRRCPIRIGWPMRCAVSGRITSCSTKRLARSISRIRRPASGSAPLVKAYAANRAVTVLKAHGVESGVVNAGGDLLVFGRREDGEARVIRVADPREPGQTFDTEFFTADWDLSSFDSWRYCGG